MKAVTLTFRETCEMIDRLSDNDMRVLFRAIVADEWSSFEPQKPQVGTKVMVREFTHRLMNWMREFTPNAKPNHFDDGDLYARVWAACHAIEVRQRRMLLHRIVQNFIRRHEVTGSVKSLVELDMTKLHTTMDAMGYQKAANQTGWKYTGEYVLPDRKKREKRA